MSEEHCTPDEVEAAIALLARRWAADGSDPEVFRALRVVARAQRDLQKLVSDAHEINNRLKSLLTRYEGFSARTYTDAPGPRTAGGGRCDGSRVDKSNDV